MNEQPTTMILSPAHRKLVELYGHVAVLGRGPGQQSGYLSILQWLQPEYADIVNLDFDDRNELTLAYDRQQLIRREPRLKTMERAMKRLQPVSMYVSKISRGDDHWKVWSFNQKASTPQSDSEEMSHVKVKKSRPAPKRERTLDNDKPYIYYYGGSGKVKAKKRATKNPKIKQSKSAAANRDAMPPPQVMESVAEMIDGTSTESPTEIFIDNLEADYLYTDFTF